MRTPLVRFYEMPAEWTLPKYDIGHVRYLVPNERIRRVVDFDDGHRVAVSETSEQFIRRLAKSRRHYFPGTRHKETEGQTLKRIYLSLRHDGESPGAFFERIYLSGGAIDDANDNYFLSRVAWMAETFQDSSLSLNTAKLNVSTEICDALESPSQRHMSHYRALRNSLRFNYTKNAIVVDTEALAYKIRKEDGWKFWRVIPRMFFGEDQRIIDLLDATGNKTEL